MRSRGDGDGGENGRMASLHPISEKKIALEYMQRAAEEAAGALREVCMVLDEIALEMISPDTPTECRCDYPPIASRTSLGT